MNAKDSLAVQRLGFWAVTAEDLSSFFNPGTQIPTSLKEWPKKKKKPTEEQKKSPKPWLQMVDSLVPWIQLLLWQIHYGNWYF